MDEEEELTNPNPQASSINVNLKDMYTHMYAHIYLLGLLVTYPNWSPYVWQASSWIVIGALLMIHAGCRLCFHDFKRMENICTNDNVIQKGERGEERCGIQALGQA